MLNLGKLFNPQSIAIIGASEEAGKIGNILAKNILELGYAGQVFLVNPKYPELLGQKCYANLAAIGAPVDLALVAVPAKFVVSVVKEGSLTTKNFVVISAGFGETDAEGKQREKDLQELATQNGLNILGPNCLGFLAPGLKLNASFAAGMPEAGNISFVSQSGAIAVAMLDMADKGEMKFSHVISVGNKMQIDEAELLEYLGADPTTKVIGMYLEGIQDGQKFLAVAQKVSRLKPIVILKAGKTEKAQQAIASHTGALAGSDLMIGALLKKAGVLRAETLEEFFQLVNLLSVASAPTSAEVAVITNAGGPGVLTTDAFAKKQISLAEFSDKTKEKLRAVLPAESSVENPVDLLGDALEDRYKKTLKIIEKEKNVGSIVCILTPQNQTPVAKVASALISFQKKTAKNVVAIFIGGGRVKKSIAKLKEHGVPVFAFPESAIDALNKFFAWGEFAQRPAIAASGVDATRAAAARQIIDGARMAGRGALLFAEAKKVMDLYGVPTVACQAVGGPEKTAPTLEFPVVAKVDSDKVLHKTDKQGLILSIQTADELSAAIAKMENNFPGECIIIQPMLARQTELIVGIKNDATVGPVIVYGLGGIYTEVFKMVNFLLPPASVEEISAELANSQIKFLFQETRGQKPYDLAELADLLAKMTRLATELPEIKELDINPLLVYNNGSAAVAVDVKIII